MPYIEREELIKDINETVVFTVRKGVSLPTSEMRGANKVIDRIKSAPTADVEKVVYCKECKHLYCCSAVDRQFYCRHIHGMKGCLNPIEENPFCSYGERKEDK